MKHLNPYLIIPGRCEEALLFYKYCFGGEVTLLQRFEDLSYPVPVDFKHKIAHAEFKSDGVFLMASDGMPEDEISNGNNIALSIHFSSRTEQDKVFELLKTDGIVTMPFQNTSVDSRLATLIDKFGIHWYLNYKKA